jgi:hypothetical protein
MLKKLISHEMQGGARPLRGANGKAGSGESSADNIRFEITGNVWT